MKNIIWGLRSNFTCPLIRNNQGAALIEFAIVVPILTLMFLGIIEFGLFFYKEQLVQRAVNNAVTSIKLNPSGANLRSTLVNEIKSVVDFDDTASGNILCADAYKNKNDATGCRNSSVFNTAKPADVNNTDPYFVVLVSSAKVNAITGLMDGFLPNDIKSTTILQIDQISESAAEKTTLPSCASLGTDAQGKLICNTPTYNRDNSSLRNCNAANNKHIETDAQGNFVCVDGAVKNVTIQSGTYTHSIFNSGILVPNGYTTQDCAFITSGSHMAGFKKGQSPNDWLGSTVFQNVGGTVNSYSTRDGSRFYPKCQVYLNGNSPGEYGDAYATSVIQPGNNSGISANNGIYAECQYLMVCQK